MALIKINGSATTSTATAEDVQQVTDLDNLHDVDIVNGLTDNDLLQYNSTTSQWENTQVPVITEMTASVGGTETALQINMSRLKTDADNFTFDDTAQEWSIQTVDSGRNNGQVILNDGAKLALYDDTVDTGNELGYFRIRNNGRAEVLSDSFIFLKNNVYISRTTDDWENEVLALSKFSTDGQLDIPLVYEIDIDGDNFYKIAKTAAYRHASNDNRYYLYVFSEQEDGLIEFYRAREDDGNKEFRLRAETLVDGYDTILRTGDNTQLHLERDSTSDSDQAGVGFRHNDLDADQITYLGELTMNKPGGDERRLRLRFTNDADDSSFTPLNVEHDFNNDQSQVELNARLIMNDIDTGTYSSNIENVALVNGGDTHDMVNNIFNFDTNTPTTGEIYKQNFNFQIQGDNVTNHQVGRLQVDYKHGDELENGIALKCETISQEGINQIQVQNKYGSTNCPFRNANIDSGTSDPTGVVEGSYFFRTDTAELKRYNGTGWDTLTDEGLQFYDNNQNRMTFRQGGNWVYFTANTI